MPSGKTLTHKVEVACRGADAKALGKHRLETELGLNVTFQSYQVAPGKQKLWLEDDDPVVSGSVLNFAVEMQAVLHQQSQHTRILAMLSRPLLQDVVSRWTACLISSKATGVAALITNVQDKVAGSALHQSLASALTSINAEMTVAQLTAQLVETYQDQCNNAHVNTTSVLHQEMEELRESGALELLCEKFPVECLIVQHHEVFLQMLD